MTDAPSDPLSLEGQLCFALYGASMAMGRAYKPLLDAIGLTFPQYLVLQALWEGDGRTIGGLAERLSLESSTITPLVKRLETAGLVTRERNARDERQVFVTLTDHGHVLKTERACITEAIVTKTGLAVAELQTLTAQMHALRRALVDAAPAD
ncbi:MarR family transcriptional regulator [Sphingomonas sp. Leaf33]|uniref:MarR family winged helix-turn-helix transcriptional regulator n=1 Tax=Sphingomonas sp. Leaf33 TaxID=1736215 RepID=UPI0006F2F44D|nr:MarR family transcriptional regulator [Sphingomonas sp. Leaf33]KQN19422.1 MarR family transcriptional regulator [Sphingomonas sp. Leaf33]